MCGARVNKSHTGQYHCCAFCSSEGQRDTVCACGGTMSGGYKGENIENNEMLWIFTCFSVFTVVIKIVQYFRNVEKKN